MPMSPLQSSGAAPSRDQSSRAQRRTPTLATGRKRERRTTRRGRDPDARFSAKRLRAREGAGRGGDLSAGGVGSDACFTRKQRRARPASPRQSSSRRVRRRVASTWSIAGVARAALPQPRDAEIRAHAVATGSGRSHAIATAVANGQVVSWMRRKSVSNKRRRCFPTSSQRLLGCSVRLTDAPRGMRACGRRGAPEPALAASCGASGGGISNAVAFHSGGLSPRLS